MATEYNDRGGLAELAALRAVSGVYAFVLSHPFDKKQKRRKDGAPRICAERGFAETEFI
jgi:hypothetical protein